MNARARELELLLLTAYAAVPLYFTEAVGPGPLIGFHVVFAAMAFQVWRGGSPAIVPELALRIGAVAFLPLYFVDARMNGAIAASTHLVLFIAIYQPVESVRRENRAQRLLVASLLFIASLSTSTNIAILAFVVVFAFFMFRQLMVLSHIETARSIGREFPDAPHSRAAWFYLAGTTVIAAILFPVIPRVRNPMVHGFTGALTNATTGLSNEIDFNQNRTSTADPSVVARVWMPREAVPFFTPLRLRGNVYDRYHSNSWQQGRVGFRPLPSGQGGVRVGRNRPGFTTNAAVQQRLVQQNKLLLPVGTYAVRGLVGIAEGPARDTFAVSAPRDVLSYDVSLALKVDPLFPRQPRLISYPVTPEVAAMARSIVGTLTDPADQARAIEEHLVRNFRYLQRPEQIGRTMTVDDFLLKERRGHCEYFAAGMVALMTAVNVPARIVGGFYGGRLNPLTGYFLVRREDAHAWVEVWDGARWETFDPTPPSLRPGNSQDGLLRTYVNAISDSVNYFWDRYVLTYGLGDQIAFAAELIARVREALSGLRGTAIRWRPGSVVSLLEWIGVIGAVIVAVAIFRRRRQTIFDLLAGQLAALGIVVGPAMTMEEALQTLRAENAAAAEQLAPLIALYEAERFSARSDRNRVKVIRRRLAELRA